MTRTHDPYITLRSGRYLRYLAAYALDICGNLMLATAIGWEVYERTGSVFALGMIGLMKFGPVLLLSIPVGHMIDSVNRKFLLMSSHALLVVACTALTLISMLSAPAWMMFPCIALVGVMLSVSPPTRAAFFPDIVGRAAIPNAIAWNHVARQIAMITGPMLAGASIALTGNARTTYIAYAIISVVVIVLIASIPYTHHRKTRETVTLSSLLAGLRFMTSSKVMLGMITVDLFAVLFGGATALLPAFAKDILHIGPVGLGFLRAAPAVGAMLTSIAVAHSRPMRRAGDTMLLAVALFGASMALFGFSTNAWLSFGLLLFSGGCDAINVLIRQTFIQTHTPIHLLGRVYSFNNIFGISSNELGEFESGIAAGLLGPARAVIFGGIASIGIVLAAMRLWPQIRTLKTLHVEETAPLIPEDREVV